MQRRRAHIDALVNPERESKAGLRDMLREAVENTAKMAKGEEAA